MEDREGVTMHVVQIAEQTPLNGLRIGQLALEAGIPAGVLNVIPGTALQQPHHHNALLYRPLLIVEPSNAVPLPVM